MRVILGVLKTLKRLLVEYGIVALLVYITIFLLVWLSFWAAIRLGWEPTTVVENAGIWFVAYLATKVTLPLRMIATLALTPLIAELYERITRRPAVADAKGPET